MDTGGRGWGKVVVGEGVSRLDREPATFIMLKLIRQSQGEWGGGFWERTPTQPSSKRVAARLTSPLQGGGGRPYGPYGGGSERSHRGEAGERGRDWVSPIPCLY